MQLSEAAPSLGDEQRAKRSTTGELSAAGSLSAATFGRRLGVRTDSRLTSSLLSNSNLALVELFRNFSRFSVVVSIF